MVERLRFFGFDDNDIVKIKIWYSAYPKEPDADCGKLDKRRMVIQNDDHDQQSSGSTSRDMGDSGCVLVKGCDPNKHHAFETMLFNHPPGVVDNDNDYPIRLILSSFYWAPNGQLEFLMDIMTVHYVELSVMIVCLLFMNKHIEKYQKDITFLSILVFIETFYL